MFLLLPLNLKLFKIMSTSFLLLTTYLPLEELLEVAMTILMQDKMFSILNTISTFGV